MARREIGRAYAARLLVLGLYLAAAFVMPPDCFWSPDEGGKYLQARATRWSGFGFEYELPYAAKRFDPELRYLPRRLDQARIYPQYVDGRLRFHWPIWFPAATAVLTSGLGIRGAYVLPLLGGWLIAVLAGRIGRRMDPGVEPAVVLAVGLATPVMFYSQMLWEHTPATFLCLAATLLLLDVSTRAAAAGGRGRVSPRAAERASDEKGSPDARPFSFAIRRARAWIGFPGRWRPRVAIVLMLIACAMRTELFAFALALSGAAVVRWCKAARFATTSVRRSALAWAMVGVCATVLLLAVFFSTGSRQREQLDIVDRLQRLHEPVPGSAAFGALLIEAGVSDGPQLDPFWNDMAVVALGLCALGATIVVSGAGKPSRRRRGVAAAVFVTGFSLFLVYSAALLIGGGRYRSLHGVFPIAPQILFFPLAVHFLRDGQHETARFLTWVAVFYLFLGVGSVWLFHYAPQGFLDSGLEWGPRYVLPIYPLLTILAVVGIGALCRGTRTWEIRYGAIAMLLAASLIGANHEVEGLSRVYETRSMLARWQSALREEPLVLTDLPWLPASLAPLFATHPMQYVEPGELSGWRAAGQVPARFVFAHFGSLDGAGAPRGWRRIGTHNVRGLQLTAFEHLETTNPPVPDASASGSG